MIYYKAWIETRTSSAAQWKHHERLEGEEENEEPGLYFTDSGMCSGTDDLAQQVLDRFLTSVLHDYPDQPDVEVRAHAQIDEQPPAEPPAVRLASSDSMAEARETLRLRSLAQGLRSACSQVFTARSTLQKAVVTAHDQGLDRYTITTAAAPELSADQVARLIDSSVLCGEVRALVRSRPALAARTSVRDGGALGVTVKLLWTTEDEEAEELRERGWNETIEEYDRQLASTLLTAARNDAEQLLALLSSQFEVLSRGDTPATPESMAPDALVYQSVDVRRSGQKDSKASAA
ncbi:hypothetical protein P8A22_38130 (plasmid) [Streptomyces laculatispora]|uniref:Uncharacterized protein n=1 Tax=Streptomyces laculatispora TaxID=887464 RepID=A0ABY9II33_9ACTN|nr:hypothetical protein [Streptomyces laculatispora]WLQ45643.1 hypothetical protein P8A22_38130 [Streptomyces laculatispora]